MTREVLESNLHPPGSVSARVNSSDRFPIPTFTGEDNGTDVITWFGQFDAYASILCLQPCEMVPHASLCLRGRAAKEWAYLKKSLLSQGKDIRNFDVFKAAMLSQYVEAEVENTVRIRLSTLKQTGSVADYYSKFRGIMVEAVKHPITGPEACSYFRAGLKPTLLEGLMQDSVVRNELSDLDVVVKAAKEVEAYLRFLHETHTQSSEDEYEADEEDEAGTVVHQSSSPPSKKLKMSVVSPSFGSRAYWLGQGLSMEVYDARLRGRRCFRCGSSHHRAHACTEEDIVLSHV